MRAKISLFFFKVIILIFIRNFEVHPLIGHEWFIGIWKKRLWLLNSWILPCLLLIHWGVRNSWYLVRTFKVYRFISEYVLLLLLLLLLLIEIANWLLILKIWDVIGFPIVNLQSWHLSNGSIGSLELLAMFTIPIVLIFIFQVSQIHLCLRCVIILINIHCISDSLLLLLHILCFIIIQ
jgi:hypothetical protein